MRVNKEITAYDFDACDSFAGSDSGAGDKATEGGGEGSGEGGCGTEAGAA